MIQAFPTKSLNPQLIIHAVKFLGTGAATPTAVETKGVTVTYVSTGKYRVTFADSPGRYIGLAGFGFEATTPGDLKGYTCVVDAPWDATNRALDVVVYNSSFNAADLAAAQYVTLLLAFARTDR